ncbi:MAG: DUF1573 domain-containing protein [Oligoflexales bacterium]
MTQGVNRLAIGLFFGFLLSTQLFGQGLYFEDTQRNFGNLFRGQKVHHDFTYENKTSVPISILGVFATCACTVTEITKGKEIAPGEKGQVRILLDTTDHLGSLDQTVTITTNASSRENTVLKIMASIGEEYSVEPPIVDFGKIYDHEPKRSQVTLKAKKMDRELDIKDIQYDKKNFEVTYEKQKDQIVLDILFKNTIVSGVLRDELHVENTSQYMPDLTIFLRANVLSPITHAPSYLEFGAVSTADRETKAIKISADRDFAVSSTKTNLRINDKAVDQPGRYVSVSLNGEGKKQKNIVVELQNRGDIVGNVYGDVVLVTNHPKQSEIKVSFYAFFKGKEK